MKIYRRKIRSFFDFDFVRIAFPLLFLLLAAGASFSACTYRSFDDPKNGNAETAPELSDFKNQIKAMQTADFDYIFAIRRPDGEILTSEDKRFIRANSHPATNRFTLTEDEKIVVAGSNFAFSEENLFALRERFEVENYSKPAAEREAEKSRTEKPETEKPGDENPETENR